MFFYANMYAHMWTAIVDGCTYLITKHDISTKNIYMKFIIQLFKLTKQNFTMNITLIFNLNSSHL